MSFVTNHPEDAGLVRVFVKGASEIVLERCVEVVKANGETEIISNEQKEDIELNVIDNYAKKAYRTLTLSYKDMSREEFERNLPYESEESQKTLENQLCLVAIVGIQDPLRKEIRQAVQDCYNSHVNVRMVTGDNIITARAIALEAGILDEKSKNK